MAKKESNSNEKTNLYLLSIVAIVAIVGIVVLILNSGGSSVSLSSDDLTGEAIKAGVVVKRPNNCDPGETACGTGCCDSMTERCGDGKCHPVEEDDDDEVKSKY